MRAATPRPEREQIRGAKTLCRSAVIGAMDSSADLSAQILNNPDLSQKLLAELVPIIYDEMKATAQRTWAVDAAGPVGGGADEGIGWQRLGVSWPIGLGYCGAPMVANCPIRYWGRRASLERSDDAGVSSRPPI